MATVEQYLSVLAGAQAAQNAEAHRAAAQMQIEVRASLTPTQTAPAFLLPTSPKKTTSSPSSRRRPVVVVLLFPLYFSLQFFVTL